MSTAERATRLGDRLRQERTAQHAAEMAGDTRAVKRHADLCDQLISKALVSDLRIVVRGWLAEYQPSVVTELIGERVGEADASELRDVVRGWLAAYTPEPVEVGVDA